MGLHRIVILGVKCVFRVIPHLTLTLQRILFYAKSKGFVSLWIYNDHSTDVLNKLKKLFENETGYSDIKSIRLIIFYPEVAILL